MKKNTFFLLVSAVVMSLILTFALSSWNQKEVEEVVIRFGTWSSSPAENLVIDRVIDTFTRKTGIYVERETYPYNYSSIMTNKLRTHQEPDVFYVSQMDYKFWQYNGWLKNLSHLVENPDDYYPSIRDTFTTQGQFYTLPKDFAAIMLYANETLLQQVGYEITDIPKDLSEFSGFLIELQAKLPEGVTAMTIDVQFENFMALFEKLDPNAYENFAFATSEPILMFIENLSHLVESGALKLMNENLAQERAGEQFRRQETVMTLEGNWLYNDLTYYETPFRYHVAELPQINGETPMAAYFTGYAVSQDTEHPEASELFVRYLTDVFSPYVVENISSFPASASDADEIFKNNNLDDIGLSMISGLGNEVVIGKSYHHVIYSYYFGVHLPEMMENPARAPEIFAIIDEETRNSEAYLGSVMEIRGQKIEEE